MFVSGGQTCALPIFLDRGVNRGLFQADAPWCVKVGCNSHLLKQQHVGKELFLTPPPPPPLGFIIKNMPPKEIISHMNTLLDSTDLYTVHSAIIFNSGDLKRKIWLLKWNRDCTVPMSEWLNLWPVFVTLGTRLEVKPVVLSTVLVSDRIACNCSSFLKKLNVGWGIFRILDDTLQTKIHQFSDTRPSLPLSYRQTLWHTHTLSHMHTLSHTLSHTLTHS